jgi:hypothetical protein
MITASECVRELLERIAAGDGVDARLERKEDAEDVRAEYVGEEPGLIIGHFRGHGAHPFCSTQEITVRPLDSPARSAATRLLLGDASHEYAATRHAPLPLTKGPGVRHHCPCLARSSCLGVR